MSYIFSYHHMVFGTKNRSPFIHWEIKDELLAYIGGICRNMKLKLISGNTMPDPIHLLVSLPSTVSLAKAANAIKSNSSSWGKDHLDGLFSWQREYGSFSVSQSQVKKTIRYIENQVKHHESISFVEEFETLLRKHDIPFERNYLWAD